MNARDKHRHRTEQYDELHVQQLPDEELADITGGLHDHLHPTLPVPTVSSVPNLIQKVGAFGDPTIIYYFDNGCTVTCTLRSVDQQDTTTTNLTYDFTSTEGYSTYWTMTEERSIEYIERLMLRIAGLSARDQ
ncbi:MAG: hypothetical protein LBJ95_03130 [Oscillospiraceae bacterium]|jgi:hypothetical protein|nr:hypothetical protein [Oscillospiraceae bacterium]